MDTLAQLARKLTDASLAHPINPYAQVIEKFPAQLDMKQWFMPPELMSLYGTPTYEMLSEEDRMRLSFLELVNLFSFTLFGERVQVEGLTRRLYRAEMNEVTPYLHFFLSEENNHMTYFGSFCQKYAGKLYPPTALALAATDREYAPGEEDFLFFIKLLIFEEIGDPFNLAIAMDASMPPFLRDLNMAHHKDEARHLAFGRELVKSLWKMHAPGWGTTRTEGIRTYLNDYFVSSWWEFYNLAVYKDAGLTGNLFEMREAAFEDPGRRAQRQKMSAGISKFLINTGILQTAADVG